MVWGLGAVMLIFVAVLSYGMTRRYGWGQALALPVLALAAVLAMQWQERGGAGFDWGSLAFAAPVLVGSVAGIVLAQLRRR